MEHALSAHDRAIVALIGEGLTRWAIAERLDLSESSVRLIVRRLCTEYQCSMRDLPDAIGAER
jgi:DNA-binding NarL/FixJ family response regulator